MFVAIGVIGAVLLLASLLLDDVIDGFAPDLDFISGPVIGGFLAGFGLLGWLSSSGLDGAAPVSLAAATVGGVAIGTFTYRTTHALMNQPTDATPTTGSLVGTEGRVVTPIPDGKLGEVLVTLGGAPTKYTAVADRELPVGATVVVVAVESPTKVRVQATADFWS